MAEENAGNAEGLAILREKAKGLGIPNFQVKGYPKLYAEVMAKQDELAEENKAQELKTRTEAEAKQVKESQKKAKETQEQELYPFTDPATNRIGLYAHTDKKNNRTRLDKGNAYVFVRWV